MTSTAPEFLVTLYDEKGIPVGIVGDYLSCEATFDDGPATVIMRGTDPLGAYAMRCGDELVPVTVEVSADRCWRGNVDVCEFSDLDGEQIYTLRCVAKAANGG